MGVYPPQLLSDIRDRVSLIALIGERVPLKKAGRNHKGLCPFHSENTPSFLVSDEKQIYHCFGCGAGGDCFQFLMKYEGVTFREAVESLAKRVGVALPRLDREALAAEDAVARQRAQYLKVNKIAYEWFAARLSHPQAGQRARAYLMQRGFSEAIATQHFLGFADNEWDGLRLFLEERKVPERLAIDLGLLKPREGKEGTYDFFRNRLLFGILSPRGEIIGFGGRWLGDPNEEVAKYVNSADSPVFHKSHTVYGLDRSAGPIRRADRVIVVEGYLDWLSLFEAGIQEVAAPLGTAITVSQIQRLARLSRNMVLMLDGDRAGREAALRALSRFNEAGMMPRVAVLPEGEDPDSLVRKAGREAIEALVSPARSLFEVFVEWTLQETGHDIPGKVAALERIAPELRGISSRIERGLYQRFVAERLGMTEVMVAEACRERPGGVWKKTLPTKGLTKARAYDAEWLLIRSVLTYPALLPQVTARLSWEAFSDPGAKKVASLLWQRAASGEEVSHVALWLEELSDPLLQQKARGLLVDEESLEPEQAAQLVHDCLGWFEQQRAREAIRTLNEAIEEAERGGDETRVVRLLEQKQRALVNKNA